jgi:TNF receptor-associated factor 4
MAASVGDLKGYDHQFVEPPPDDLICLICLCVARDPQQINCCGKVLCKGCLEEHKKNSTVCPQCRKNINSFADKRSKYHLEKNCMVHKHNNYYHNTTGERHILSLKARCDNTSNGCEWAGELRSLDEHLAGCGFTLLSCPNNCQNGDKVVQLFRKDVQRHTKEQCPRRQYKCRHCLEVGEHREMTTKHLEKCPMLEVPCPRPGCKIRIARCNLLKHQTECQFEIVPCKYVIIGCKKEALRKDMAEHEGDTQQHLQLAVDTVYQQQITIREQESMLAHLRSREMPMKYKFTAYDHHKTTDDAVYSPGFYTSPGGYKMCVRVWANGCRDGHSTHVSISANLMKGENDDHLPWPFTGTVTFELLNQLEDKNHYSKYVTFLPDEASSQRTINAERSSTGYGMPGYISHSALGYNAAKNCQYLRNDFLYFRVNVNARSSSKPWLV